jgi:hypothetical protein
VQRLQIASANQKSYASGFGTSLTHRGLNYYTLLACAVRCGVLTHVSVVSLYADTTLRIWREEGVRGYYRGFGAMLLTYIPGSVVWWVSYEHCKARPQLSFQLSRLWASASSSLDWRTTHTHTHTGGVLAIHH